MQVSCTAAASRDSYFPLYFNSIRKGLDDSTHAVLPAGLLAGIADRKSDLKPAGFLAGIASRKSELKHVSKPAPAAQSLGSGGQGGMMAAIMARGAQLKHVDTDKTGIAKQAALSRKQGGAEANAHAALLQATGNDSQPRPRTRTKSNFRKSVFEGATLKKGWLQKRSTGKRAATQQIIKFSEFQDLCSVGKRGTLF